MLNYEAHKEPHPYAGKTVRLNLAPNPIAIVHRVQNTRMLPPQGAAFHVEDWWDRVNGKSWRESDGVPAVMNYAFRAGCSDIEPDDNVVYGKVNGLGYIVHNSEIVPLEEPSVTQQSKSA